MNHFLRVSAFICLLYLTNPFLLVYGNCTCKAQYKDQNQHGALEYKVAAIASILLASAFGVCIPLLLKNVRSLQLDSAIHFLIKAFAAGVIWAAGFIHTLPEVFQNLSSPCLGEKSWGAFPFTGLIMMISCILTMLMEALATGYHRRAQLGKALPVETGEAEQEICDLDVLQ